MKLCYECCCNCDGNKNICEAIIVITFPCKQTIMKYDMNEFNLTQFECRIQKPINFYCLCYSNYKKIITIPLQCDFFLMKCNLSYGQFLSFFFYQLTSEKNQVHSSNLTRCQQTPLLIKFYLIKNIKGNRGSQLSFPS